MSRCLSAGFLLNELPFLPLLPLANFKRRSMVAADVASLIIDELFLNVVFFTFVIDFPSYTVNLICSSKTSTLHADVQ
jgi:hypothetical protein